MQWFYSKWAKVKRNFLSSNTFTEFQFLQRFDCLDEAFMNFHFNCSAILSVVCDEINVLLFHYNKFSTCIHYTKLSEWDHSHLLPHNKIRSKIILRPELWIKCHKLCDKVECVPDISNEKNSWDFFHLLRYCWQNIEQLSFLTPDIHAAHCCCTRRTGYKI